MSLEQLDEQQDGIYGLSAGLSAMKRGPFRWMLLLNGIRMTAVGTRGCWNGMRITVV